MRDFGILWLNARNLQYITKFNPKKQIRLATNKFQTKEFLMQRWIPVPKTYAHITHRDHLFHTNFANFNHEKFVVKPNRWSQWNWIYIIKDVKKIKSTEKKVEVEVKRWFVPQFIATVRHKLKKKYYDSFYAHLPHYPYEYRIWSNWIADFDFKQKLVHILDWQYRIWNKPDSILIEEYVEAGEWFEAYCERWLADVRIISFNLVPIAAMVRVPTEKSEGKANIAQWGIALWVDVATWRISSLSWKWAGKVFSEKFPPEYAHFKDMKVPHWNELLQLSANAQFFVNIWYVGLDWVITKKWPMLIELNGRAWIEIQNITRQPLLSRMRKIEDMAIRTPKKWVEIAHALFNEAKAPVKDAQFLYLSQSWILSKPWDTAVSIDVIATAVIQKKRNYISRSLMNKLDTSRLVIKLPDSNIRTVITVYVSDKVHGHKIVLWTDFLQDYMLKAEHKSHPHIEFIHKRNLLEDEFQDLQILDQNLLSLSKKINLSSALKPINYLSELDTFISKKWKYNPRFRYSYPSKNSIQSWKDNLKRLYDQQAGGTLLESGFAQLFYDKMHELDSKIGLIDAYVNQNLDKMYKYNKAIFGKFDNKLLKESKQKIETYDLDIEVNMWRKLSWTEVKKEVLDYLKKKNLTHIPVYTTTRSMSRISIWFKHWKPFINLLVTDRGSFLEAKMEAKLVHEIDVHLMRYINWQKSGRNIMTMWTAWYVKDEEGLAIWNAEQVMRKFIPEHENLAIYEKYYWLSAAQELSFRNLAEFVMDNKYDNSRIKSWSWVYNTCLKMKRGVQNTEIIHPGAVYLKDKVYLEWYDKIRDHVAKNWKIDERLMVWKIKLEDLDSIF